ncbi:MAG: hypothetical protein AB1523_15060 [Bacillota bacterium]
MLIRIPWAVLAGTSSRGPGSAGPRDKPLPEEIFKLPDNGLGG